MTDLTTQITQLPRWTLKFNGGHVTLFRTDDGEYLRRSDVLALLDPDVTRRVCPRCQGTDQKEIA